MIHKMRQVISIALVLALTSLGLTVQAQWQRPYRVSDSQVRQLIRRIENRTVNLRGSLDASLDRSRIDGTRAEDNINEFIRNFEDATSRLRDRFERRQSVASDVQEVLDRAAYIDSFMQRYRFNTRTQNIWLNLRSDLNTLASYYNVSWRWDGRVVTPTVSQSPYRVSDMEVRQLIQRIEDRASRFRDSLSYALDRSRIDGTRREDNINEFVRDFDDATSRLRDRFNNRLSTSGDVQEVLDRAARIDNFMRRNRLDTRTQSDWASLRADLDTLASYYSVAWNWNNPATPSFGIGTTAANRLTGTYRLDASRSDDPRDAAERATRTLPYADRQRTLDALTARLESPDRLAIERRGRTVIIASSRSPQITFEADGRESVEQMPNGQTIRARATLNGEQLVVTTTGNRGSDYEVTFNPIDNGRRLSVTRRITTDNLNRPVVVQSTYDKISEIAQFDIYDGGSAVPSTGATSGDFVVPNGTTLVAVLNDNLTTAQARDGDRFTMTVQSPTQFEGAVIEGHVTDVSRSGRILGRSGMTFNFDSIRLRDGRTYKFAGFVQNVRTASGETVNVDNEGTVQEGDSRGSTTAQRAAIGTALGALIGAIAGGGKGAAIGAIIGAGAGAGSVYVQGRDDLELLSGTEVTVSASAPR